MAIPCGVHALQVLPAGSKFNRWRLLSTPRLVPGTRTVKAVCECDCGAVKRVNVRNVVEGKSKSCGCLAKEWMKSAELRAATEAARIAKHGPARTGPRIRTAYNHWYGMIRRCEDTSHASYKNYGGRGISVCQRWRSSFEAFVADMGPRPSGYSLDRINNDGNYEPGNCRWATAREQRLNSRPRRKRAAMAAA